MFLPRRWWRADWSAGLEREAAAGAQGIAWVRRLAVRATTALVAMTAEGAGAATAWEAAQVRFSFLDEPDGERHQAAVAEARRHLGGGGKRGWLA